MINRPISPQFRGYFEIQPRIINDSDRVGPVLIRPAIGYNLRPNVSLWLGYAYIPTYNPNRSDENRLFQQLLVTSKYPRFDLINRTRLEERFLPGADDPSLRFRHFIRIFYPLDKTRKWSLVGQEEIFFNLNSATPNLQRGYDQNRIFAGVGYTLSKSTRFEIGYQYVHVRVPTAAPDRHLHTILTMWHVNL
jgi:hypothetical protein